MLIAEALAPPAFRDCPLCGGSDCVLLHPSTLPAGDLSNAYSCTSDSYGIHGDIVGCRACGLMYLARDVEEAVLLEAVGDVQDPVYLKEEEGRRATFARQLRRVERYAGWRGRLLEGGAYTGVFLDVARSAGWEVAGIEPSSWAVDVCRAQKDIELVHGRFVRGHFPPGSFDAVVMWDVIEHFHDPLGAVATAREYLRAGGLLALSTMDVASLVSRFMGARWPWYMQMHRTYFSRPTMRALLLKAGFESPRFVTHTRHVSLGYLAPRVEMRFPTLGRLLATPTRFGGLDSAIVPFRAGDLFEVYARKPLTA